ncbi:MAG: V-type ATPase subunit [Chloroflexi bacterium]|nr:V-type ATPase subunit [Chloroflexota bacterium]
MPDYDYGNARLHVMKSRLLSSHELETLAETGSLQGLIAALTKTVYQKSVETALTRATGMQCIDEALRTDLVNTVGKIRGFYMESAGKMTAIVLRTYDIHNLKAILRGISKNVPAGDILTVLLPIGELSMSTLRELTQLNNPREAIDLLASMGLSFAWPLLNVRAEAPGAETFEMELALDQWYYEEARQTLRSETGMVDPLSHALALEADLVNVLTVLRFAQFPHERDLLRDRLGTDEIEHLFIGSGHIPFELLANACRQDMVAPAIETLSGTFLEPALRAGLEAYTHSNRLSDIERHLKHYRLEWMAEQIAKDPLGIGVVLGYVALKINEIGNIRWITQGINLGLKPDAIRAELEMV